MNFVDKALVRLADPATRGGLFDDASLGQLLSAAYDLSLMPIQGPFQTVFETMQIGFTVPKLATLDGYWCPTGSADRVDVRWQIAGFADSLAFRVDALWKGQIVARTSVSGATVDQVRTAWPSLGAIDAAIVTAQGSLPADPTQLEQARRGQLLAGIRGGFSQPAAFTDAMLDDWLATVGAPSVGSLISDFGGTVDPAAVSVRFTAAAAPPPAPRALPIAAALLVRDGATSVADLLMQTKEIRQKLAPLGLDATAANVPLREPLLMVWVLPAAVFDDADWPGADNATRRTTAGAWLANEGIGLVAVA